ncbi:hypothetical protein CAEBREN_21682 [Caenorhabditis brenneri]|uniref:Uncharacterized protein n=1 Tax=Caenorhabditis brenneri TaxID=135651 RepID=G0NNU6_CAEBE|nr:hypothetical protein CAEBREN_21682 [Caenorhabditis brenneri]
MQDATIFLFPLLVICAFATENSILESETESAQIGDDVICLFQIRCFSMLTIRRLEEAAANRQREEMREIHKRNAERFHFYIQNNGPKEVF